MSSLLNASVTSTTSNPSSSTTATAAATATATATGGPITLSTPMTLKDLRFFKPADRAPAITYPNGDQYFGLVRPTSPTSTVVVPHGLGVFCSADGLTRYCGEWAEGVRCGNGVALTPTMEYEGQWANDKPHGTGSMQILSRDAVAPNSTPSGHVGSMYSGVFDSQFGRHGKGVMVLKNSESYEGEFAHNLRHGRGTYRFSNREVYDGEWKEDERTGTGTMHYLNGDVFTGEWLRGKKHGKGLLRLRGGDTLDATWSDDQQKGPGVMSYKNGDMYDGNWRNGVRHGHGVFFHAKSKSTYDGEFERGLMHGRGRLQYPGRYTFEGTFAFGERQRGIMSFVDGSCYEGEWKSDKFHGRGVWWGPDDAPGFYYGQFAVGVRAGFGCLCEASDDASALAKTESEEQRSPRIADRNIEFVGDFSNDKKNGTGLLHDCRTGRIKVGTWKNNEPELPFYSGEWDRDTMQFHGFGELV
eukprot:PhM_4_TR18080/c1_g1_i1/m.106359